MKQFTIGEIFRLKLIKKIDGTDFAHKSGVANALNRFFKEEEFIKEPTSHGLPAKFLSEDQINFYNKSQKLKKTPSTSPSEVTIGPKLVL